MNEHVFKLNVAGAFLRRTDLSRSNLERANLSRADFSGALFVGANFKDAILDGTILIGADLSEARNLTAMQLSKAVIDGSTRLPDYLTLSDVKSVA